MVCSAENLTLRQSIVELMLQKVPRRFEDVGRKLISCLLSQKLRDAISESCVVSSRCSLLLFLITYADFVPRKACLIVTTKWHSML
jgi:hypothetical protein